MKDPLAAPLVERPGWRAAYDRIAPALVVICLLASLFASVGTFWTARVNDAQDRQRTADNTHLLECFDTYAKASSASSAAVRKASVKKDEATTLRDNALNAEGRAFLVVVQHILADRVKPTDVRNLADTLARRAAAGALLDHAQQMLDQARDRNPVPPPPSEFCSVQP